MRNDDKNACRRPQFDSRRVDVSEMGKMDAGWLALVSRYGRAHFPCGGCGGEPSLGPTSMILRVIRTNDR